MKAGNFFLCRRKLAKKPGDRPVAPTRILIAVILLLSSRIPEAFGAEALKKIRIASKGGGEALVPYVIPQRLGFYRDEGLDVDVIVTRGTVTTQVVVSGAVDYSNGGSIPAILSGARLKILLVNSDKPAQYLVTSPKIANIKQLSGKSMAISDTSGNSTLILREFLAKNGLASTPYK
jgi:ABC-type nitrate/sulfonate/bicarbonate transport system substrate-binding protein